MKNVQQHAQITIQQLREALQERTINRYYCVGLFGDLLEAEEAHIINAEWRQHIDVMHVENIVLMNSDWIAQRWDKQFRQLRRILEYGGHLLYEEAMLVLSLRSGLQSVARFLPTACATKLKEVDAYLAESLEQNAQMYNECRRKETIGIEKFVPTYWWWRGS